VHARAVTLVEALRFHPQAPEVTRQEAARFRRVVFDRNEEFRVALRRDDANTVEVGALGLGMLIGLIVGMASHWVVGLAFFTALLGAGFFVRQKMLEKRPYSE